MRLWLVLILSASFALQGWASTQVLEAPCPMQAEMAAGIAQMDEQPQPGAVGAVLEDCCNDMATFFLTGQACKTGQDCQAPLSALLLPPALRAAPVLTQTVVVASTPAALSPVPVAVWRPPTSR